MKTDELKEQGLTDEQIAFVMAGNGKDLKKLQREVENLTADRDTWKQKAEAAEETLKGFDGVDVATMNQEIESWKQRAAEAEENAKKQLYERDFNEVLNAEFEKIKFTSDAAKRDVMSQVRAAELKLSDGKILGLNDLVTQIKEKDASAFVDEEQLHAQQNAARFTEPIGSRRKTPGAVTHEDFKKMSLDERMKLKRENPELYEAIRR